MNKEVIRIHEINKKEELPVRFTHILDIAIGWDITRQSPNDYIEVIYLGKCSIDGDMFSATYKTGSINIFKGNLNSGKY